MLLALLVASCDTAHEHSLTYKLWDKGARSSCRPAPEAHFAVFASETNRDVLVTYDAWSERHDQIQHRAYFVDENEARIAERQRPHYVEPSLSQNMNAVPVVATSNAVPKAGRSARYPVKTDGVTGFELYRDGRSEGTHDLPIYNEGQAEGLVTVSKVALTPLAVAGDTIMVGVVVGAAAAVGWVAAGCPPFTQSR